MHYSIQTKVNKLGGSELGVRILNTLGDRENVEPAFLPLIEIRVTSKFWSSSQLWMEEMQIRLKAVTSRLMTLLVTH